MIAAPLLVVGLALAPTGHPSRFDLGASATFVAADWSERDTPSLTLRQRGSSLGGQGGVGLTLFLERVIDDDAPPSLQPYLQRTSTFHVDGGGGGFAQSIDDGGGGALARSQTRGWADLSLEGFPGDVLYGYAHLGVDYVLWSAAPTLPEYKQLTVPVDVAGGFRLHDTTISIGWGVVPTSINDGVFKVPFWGGARASVMSAVRQRLFVEGGILVLDGGAGGYGHVVLHLLRRFDLSAWLKGGHQEPSTTHTKMDYAGFTAGFGAWLSSRLYAGLDYRFQWTGTSGAGVTETAYEHSLSLSFALRR